MARPVGKRISREHFSESMKLILVALTIFLALMTLAQCQKTAEERVNEGIALNNQGKYDEAIKAYDVAIKLDPKNAIGWGNKGVALCGLEKYDEAAKCGDEALKLDPESAVGWFVKGAILDVQGEYGEAIQAYKNASILDKKYNLGNQYDINMRSLGNFHYDEREYEAALLYYYEAIMQDPANPEPRYDYANTLKMLHRNTEAEEVYAAAQKLGDTRMMGTRKADTIRDWGEDPWGE